MNKFKTRILALIFLTMFSGLLSATLNIAIYSESIFKYFKAASVGDTNYSWEFEQANNNPYLYYELKISGTIMKDMYFWTKWGGNNDNQTLINLTGHEAHIQYKVKNLMGGNGEVILFQNQDRFNMNNPILKNLVTKIGGDDKKMGIYWDMNGFLGLDLFKGFIVDGKPITDDTSMDTDFAFRIRKDFMKSKIKVGFTQNMFTYYDVNYDPVTNSAANHNGWYSMTAVDLQVTAIPQVFIGAEVAKAYAPWGGYDGRDFSDLAGKLVFTVSYDFKKLGQLHLLAYAHYVGENFSLDKGDANVPDEKTPNGSAPVNKNRFIEFIEINYSFPLKAIYLKSSVKYSHKISDWKKGSFHLWDASKTIDGVGITSLDDYAFLQNYNQLYIEFINGFFFKTYWNHYVGKNISKGVNGVWDDVLFELAVENKYGKIKPQVKLYNIGDPVFATIGYGAEMLINVSKTFRVYGRFALMSSLSELGGRYESRDNEKAWGNMYLELQYSGINNAEVYLRYGNGSRNEFLAETFALVEGYKSENRFELQIKYWL